jgi:hypothetical protein
MSSNKLVQLTKNKLVFCIQNIFKNSIVEGLKQSTSTTTNDCSFVAQVSNTNIYLHHGKGREGKDNSITSLSPSRALP